MSHVALATCSALPNLSADDRLLAAALGEAGIRASPAVWDDAAVDWSGFDVVVLRSTWDYHLRLPRFRAWLDRLDAGGTTIWNPPTLVRWNAHKGYLRELQAAGVPVVPTRWVEPGAAPDLAAILAEQGWTEAVVKPAVSAAAHRTVRVRAADAPARRAEFTAAAAALGGLLVQPYLPEIAAGELSLVFVAGAFSHAVLKRPAAGDFRVQGEFGGRHEPVEPTLGTIAQARMVLAAAGSTPLFARVDGLELGASFVLMELELIEPTLFFGTAPGAARRLADAIAGRLGTPSP